MADQLTTEGRVNINTAHLSERTFRKFSDFIHARFGIKLPPAKRIMLESRLRKRLRELNIADFDAYAEYVLSGNNPHELINMADVVSTNKTDFFREPYHFTLLSELVLPDLLQKRHGRSKPLQVWSAACSTGEEPYTLAMVLSEYAETQEEFPFRILATDLSTRVLKHAGQAVYAERRVAPIEMELRRKYLLRSKDPGAGVVRITPQLRKLVQFRRLNFLEDPYPEDHCMDVIFCRNVLIYFDRETQQNILSKMCATLRPGGYLFVGHSETLNGLNLPVKVVKSTLYRKL
ncbi:MAG: protein-glutamate O-methyltransferase [Pontiellaceae bacterium]|nr:protein-glutamate O-methyltransferase [Pontiellaceae bacterium]MBN2785901.1 protein-glutamate O-methyltransferase [Pontiellaceae bacterium]